MKYILILLTAALWSCGHIGHNNDAHEGHDHATEEALGHEGHNHKAEEAEEAGHPEDEIIFTHEQAEATGLTVETVEPGKFNQIIKVGGRVQSSRDDETVVVARSGGVVAFAGSLTEGRAVAKGETIATVSARGMTEGDVAARAQIEFETARREYRRAEGLVESQIVSQKEFDEAWRRYETARAALPEGATAAGVKVTTPIAGYIKNLTVGQGQYVEAGQPVATVTANNKLLLRADVPERNFGELASITGANFKTSYGDAVYRADRLLSYGRSAEGGYIPVTLEFRNTGNVMPGAFVEVWLTGRAEQNVLTVPKSSLSEQQGIFYVYVQLDEEGYLKREVAVGADNGERVQVLSGLAAGEKVVTRGVTQVRLAAMSGIIPEGHSHTH
jgi:RND family efflux transporter MFP subunit